MSGRWASSDRRNRLPANWQAIRLSILARDGHRCRVGGCYRPATEVDHIRAGDDHSPGNLRAICSRCHAVKSAMEGVAARKTEKRKQPEGHPGVIGRCQ